MIDTYLSTNIKNDDELDELIEKITKIDYHTFYRGVVVDNHDSLGLGRVKIRIPQLYGASPSDSLYVPTNGIPYAIPGYMPMGNDSGSYLVPNIGDIVLATFENGDPDLPIYFGGILTNRDGAKQLGSFDINNGDAYSSDVDDKILETKNDTERVIYKSIKGAIIMVDETDGKECIRITDQSGQSIIMENLSSDTLNRRYTSLGKNPESQIVITNNSGDSIKLSKGNIVIKSTNVIIESDNFRTITSSDEYIKENELANEILGGDPNEL